MKNYYLRLLAALVACLTCALAASAAEAYANYMPSTTTLTFYYDDLRSTRAGTNYNLNTGNNQPGWYTGGIYSAVTRVVFDSSFANARPTTAYYWFYGMSELTGITNIKFLNTSQVTNMAGMFTNCSKLTSLDLSGFNTANVTTMRTMFRGCSQLSSLTSISFDISSFNTANVTDMIEMFYGCSELTTINVRSFNTAKVKAMRGMFQGCSKLERLDLRGFNTAEVTGMSHMFESCTSLKVLDLSSFNTAKVTSMYSMFYKSSNLWIIYVGNGWKTDAVTNSADMFKYCTSLVGSRGTSYNASHADAAYAHIDGGASNPGYFTAAVLRGDVNVDGSLTISDVTALIDYLLGSNTRIVSVSNADCNGDANVTITDVTVLIDFLLSGAWPDVVTENDYVNLGLPSGTLWATRNVGAGRPEDYGDYFAWGEWVPKEVYSQATYKWYDVSNDKLTKYCADSHYGTYDGKTQLELLDDVAYMRWGNKWRMPTRDQVNELKSHCTWQWTTRNDVLGFLLTGPNGKTMFLPAAGCRGNDYLINVGYYGNYWSSTLYTNFSTYSYLISFEPKGWSSAEYASRFFGRSVRPVRAL